MWLVVVVVVCGISQLQAFTPSIDRFHEVKYSVVIQQHPHSQEQEGTLIPIISPGDKRKFNCWLPPQWIEDEEEQKNENIPSISTLLEPLATSCLYKIGGWWTYEFCFGKHIRQYHQEKDKLLRAQDEFYLGRKLVKKKPEETKDYYEEYYESGTMCDLTGERRRSEVRYYCGKDKSVSSIADIKEPSSCNYIISITTPLLCKHPHFKPPKEKKQIISCSPIDDGQVLDMESTEDFSNINHDFLDMSSSEDDPKFESDQKKKSDKTEKNDFVTTENKLRVALDNYEMEEQIIEIPLEELLAQVNDPTFGDILTQKLLEMNAQQEKDIDEEDEFHQSQKAPKKKNVQRLE